MIAFLYYPLYLCIFWYKDVVGGVINFFVGFNRYTASLLSLKLLIKTFFKPLKNEYRQGLVFFSIIFGMGIKSILVAINLCIVLLILLIEVFIIIFLVMVPLLLVYLVLYGSSFNI